MKIYIKLDNEFKAKKRKNGKKFKSMTVIMSLTNMLLLKIQKNQIKQLHMIQIKPNML